jgi:hypothetical protein
MKYLSDIESMRSPVGQPQQCASFATPFEWFRVDGEGYEGWAVAPTLDSKDSGQYHCNKMNIVPTDGESRGRSVFQALDLFVGPPGDGPGSLLNSIWPFHAPCRNFSAQNEQGHLNRITSGCTMELTLLATRWRAREL